MSQTPDPLRSALRELAEAEASELIPRVRERALERAEKLIEDALVEELVAAAGRGRRPSPSASPVGGNGEDPPGEAWWTYCVLDARDADDLPSELDGVEPGSLVEVLRERQLAALVSAVPADEYDDVHLREHLEDLEWVERTARRHEAVLEAALANVTIVPLRLCTLYHDREGVRRLLRDHAASLRRSLVNVDGCAEWGVKVFAGSVSLEDEEQAAEEQQPVAQQSGASYLAHRQRERDRAERASELRTRCVEEVHRRVSDCARESTANPPQRAELHGRDMAMVLNGVYLVERERAKDLYRTVGELEAEWAPRGFVIELTGPWPAYNFVSGATGVMP
jgi:hypothetical protein